MELNELQQVEGMEDFEEDYEGVPFLQILNSSAAEKLELPSGTIINNRTKDVLFKKGEPIKFIPIKFAHRWTIWDDNNMPIKYTFDPNSAAWSDGTPILNEEVSWVGSNPPLAVKSLDVIVMLPEDKEGKHYMLSLGFKNKHITAAGKQMKKCFQQTVIQEKPPALRNLIFQVTVTKAENNAGKFWQEFTETSFIGKVNEKQKLLADKIYPEVKNFNKQVFQVKQAALKAATVSTEVVTEEPGNTVVEVTDTPKF